MTTTQQIIATAKAEVGYSRWEDDAPGTKYGRWYAQVTNSPAFGASGVPYCDMFVSWVLYQCGINWVSAYVPGRESQARSRGVLIDKWSVQPGDLVTFDFEGRYGEAVHIGIATTAPYGDKIGTVEGNTTWENSGPQDNGGVVSNKQRDMSDIRYGIRVVSNVVGNPNTPADITAIQRAIGAEPDNILGPDTELRMHLIIMASTWAGRHFPLGIPRTQSVIGTEPDGIWGEASEAAHDRVTASIQRALGVEDDGIWGQVTWAAWEALARQAERP